MGSTSKVERFVSGALCAEQDAHSMVLCHALSCLASTLMLILLNGFIAHRLSFARHARVRMCVPGFIDHAVSLHFRCMVWKHIGGLTAVD